MCVWGGGGVERGSAGGVGERQGQGAGTRGRWWGRQREGRTRTRYLAYKILRPILPTRRVRSDEQPRHRPKTLHYDNHATLAWTDRLLNEVLCGVVVNHLFYNLATYQQPTAKHTPHQAAKQSAIRVLRSAKRAKRKGCRSDAARYTARVPAAWWYAVVRMVLSVRPVPLCQCTTSASASHCIIDHAAS